MSLFYKIFLVNAVLLLSSSAQALSVGQGSDFETGTLEGWGVELSVTPSIIADNGPSAAGSNAIEISASGLNGAGSKLVTLNRQTPWTGAISSDVTALTMDLKHTSGSDLLIRFAIGDGGTWYASNTPHSLLSGGDWEQAFFSLSDLTKVSGSANLVDVINNVTEVRLLHSLTANFKGDVIAASFAVDNISAVPVPAAVWLFASALGLLGIKRRKTI